MKVKIEEFARHLADARHDITMAYSTKGITQYEAMYRALELTFDIVISPKCKGDHGSDYIILERNVATDNAQRCVDGNRLSTEDIQLIHTLLEMQNRRK